MGKLTYVAICSLDGFIQDERGDFDWAQPGEEVHEFVNDLERRTSTYLYGRRMYETMVWWETGEHEGVYREYADIWRGADKIVFSGTLRSVSSERTRLERQFVPGAIERLKETSVSDLSIGGATIAGQAIAAGLVDECHLFLHPVLVGGGKRALPSDVRLGLELQDERRFPDGVVYLRYGL